MNIRVLVALLGPSMALSGCASIFDGTHEDISILSDPPGAICALSRAGKNLGSVATTPGIIRVRRTKDSIVVTCRMAGYQNGRELLHSGISRNVFGDIVLGSLLGIAIDSSTGADNDYPGAVMIHLAPDGQPQQAGGQRPADTVIKN